MKTKRLARLLRLLSLLQSRRAAGATQLAELLGVSRRTLFRDMSALQEAGFPCGFDLHSGRYGAGGNAVLPPLHLSPAEALSLVLMVRTLLDTDILPDPRATLSAGMKVESLLPHHLRDYCGPLVEHVAIRPPAKSDARAIEDALALLMRAVAARIQVHIGYDSYSPRTRLDTALSVYRIAFIGRGWYAIGRAEALGEVRTFKIERITRINLLEETYEIPADFDLDGYFGNAWSMIREPPPVHVRIEFEPKVAGNVEEVLWHKTQRVTHRDDGGIVFEVDVDGIREISWWILGYGDQARVIQPPELRDLIADRARRMCAYYRSNGDDAGADRGGRSEG